MAADLVHQLADRRVGIRNFAVVRLRGVFLFEWRGWIVGIVRVIEMKPQEKRPVRQLTQPRERAIDDIAGPSLNRLVAVRAMTTQVETGVVDFESAIEAGRGAIEGIENQRTDKGARVVALGVQQVG